MPRPKKDPLLVALGDVPEKWNQFLLKTYGLPEDPQPRDEVSESAFQGKDGDPMTLDDVAKVQIRHGEEPPRGLAKVWADYSGFEQEPTEHWLRSIAFLRVFVRIWATVHKLPERERGELLKIVDDHRPSESLPLFPDSLGTPEEFLGRWKRGELDVRFTAKNRATQMFEIWQHAIPPDKSEDLDPADEPAGHWEGLTWMPEQPGVTAETEGS